MLGAVLDGWRSKGPNKKRAFFFVNPFQKPFVNSPCFFNWNRNFGQFDRFYEEHVPKFLNMMVLLIAHGYN